MQKLAMSHPKFDPQQFVKELMECTIKKRIFNAAREGCTSVRFSLFRHLGLEPHEVELRNAVTRAIEDLGFNWDCPVEHVCDFEDSCRNCHVRSIIVSWSKVQQKNLVQPVADAIDSYSESDDDE